MELVYLLYSYLSPHWTAICNGAAMPLGGSTGGAIHLGHSLGGNLTVEVMFNLGFFTLDGNPSLYMREFCCGYVYVYSERERERRLCESEEGIREDLL